MILVKAAKLATAQRYAVRKVAQYVKGEFKIDDKIKMLNLQLDKDIYTSRVPNKLKEYTKVVADKTGEYSKNPIKKITSWIKSYIENFKELFKEFRNSKKVTPEIKPETPETTAPKPEKIIFSKDDI